MRHILQCGGHPRGSVITEVMNATTLMLIKYYLWLPLILINGNY